MLSACNLSQKDKIKDQNKSNLIVIPISYCMRLYYLLYFSECVH